MVLRLAVYASPRPGTDWHRLATSWLGYDSVTGRSVAAPGLQLLGPDEMSDLTATPATYGFHATLRSPFHLAEDVDVAECLQVVEEIAATLFPVAPRLQIGRLGGFAAFLPATDHEALAAIERACVLGLDATVGVPDRFEVERRLRAGLTERQAELLARWGYPYVLDEFRFHLTLTRRLDDDEAGRVLRAARAHFGHLDGAAFPLDDLVVLIQRDGRSLVELARFPLVRVLPG